MNTPLEWDALWGAMKSNPEAWIPTTENMYQEMLNALPPRAWRGGAFLVGEAANHNDHGEAVYTCFRKVGDNYVARDLTVREFNGL